MGCRRGMRRRVSAVGGRVTGGDWRARSWAVSMGRKMAARRRVMRADLGQRFIFGDSASQAAWGAKARRRRLGRVRVAVKWAEIRRPCQRRRMRRRGPFVRGILRGQVRRREPKRAKGMMKEMWPRVWEADMKMT